MAEVAQIVATKEDGECPVALTPFLPLADVSAQLEEFRRDGYGQRQASRPLLEVRDQSGGVIDVKEGVKVSASAKKRAASESES